MARRLEAEPLNILLTGVGGQGNVLAARVIAMASVASGYQVAVGETFGASQRGGTVASHVRLALKDRYGPLIPRGEAHVIVGFEPLEACRALLAYGNINTYVLANWRPLPPVSVLQGEEEYPALADLERFLLEHTGGLLVLDATARAQELGSAAATNMVLTGALVASGLLPLDPQALDQVLKELFTDAVLELNRKALAAGMAVWEQSTPQQIWLGCSPNKDSATR
ncbi:MAG: indolepyruvate oxidoreductase subunit beta [Clostridia bacterium]|nr:indolepyruvate oxidoreductase subunit beta [Clostridia bacterium]